MRSATRRSGRTTTLGDERLDWLRRLPAERRLRVDEMLVLVTHASPGSQTAGFDIGLDASVTIERLSRTDARLICCGHTHLPEVRDFGFKQIINGGSAGYVFDGDPTASWALIDIDGDDGPGRDPAGGLRHDGGERRPVGARACPATSTARPRSAPGSSSGDRTRAPRRVVVTGMGVVTALGNDVPSTWAGLAAGRSGVRTITAFDPSRVTSQIAGEVHDLDASHVLDRKELRRTDRYIAFGLVAAREAMDQAGLPERLEGDLAEATGVILGTGLGGVGTLTDNITINAERGPDRISPFFIPMGIPNIGAGQIAINSGALGPNFAVVSACATGGHAIGEAWETIRRGDADVMLAGGTEAGIYEPLVGGFCAMRALSTRNDDPEGASRPFDQGRDGFVVGEGAGVLVLEELEHAQARGAAAAGRDRRLRRDGRRRPHHAAGRRRDRRGPGRPAGAREGRPRRPRRSTTSTPTRPRRRRATRPSSRRSGRSSATHAPARRDHRQQEHDRPHARRGRRDRGDRHDHDDARRAACRRRSTWSTPTSTPRASTS